MKNILIFGTNDVATATAIRLFRSGFSITLLADQNKFDLAHFRNFSPVLSIGKKTILGVSAISHAEFLFHTPENTNHSITYFLNTNALNRHVSVIEVKDIKAISPSFWQIVIRTDKDWAELFEIPDETLLINCFESPGHYEVFCAGEQCGCVNYPFLDLQRSKEVEVSQSVQSPHEGIFMALKEAGDNVSVGEKVATLNDTIIEAPLAGLISGIIPSGVIAAKGIPLLRIDPFNSDFDVQQIPFKAFAIAGGVLEAIMYDNEISKRW